MPLDGAVESVMRIPHGTDAQYPKPGGGETPGAETLPIGGGSNLGFPHRIGYRAVTDPSLRRVLRGCAVVSPLIVPLALGVLLWLVP